MSAEDKSRQSPKNPDCTPLANPDMVPNPTAASMQSTMDSTPSPVPSNTSLSQRSPHSAQQTPSYGMSCVRGSFSHYQLLTEVTDVIISSWRIGTQKQYATYLNKWVAFCGERQINHYSPPISETLQFLMSLYNQGLSYSTINTTRSMFWHCSHCHAIYEGCFQVTAT